MSNGADSVAFSNIAATTAAFTLKGGKYAVAVTGTGFGTVKLQRLGPDGSTYQSVSSGTDFSAAGYVALDLPPGQYKFVIATTTAVYAEATAIPQV